MHPEGKGTGKKICRISHKRCTRRDSFGNEEREKRFEITTSRIEAMGKDRSQEREEEREREKERPEKLMRRGRGGEARVTKKRKQVRIEEATAAGPIEVARSCGASNDAALNERSTRGRPRTREGGAIVVCERWGDSREEREREREISTTSVRLATHTLLCKR